MEFLALIVTGIVFAGIAQLVRAMTPPPPPSRGWLGHSLYLLDPAFNPDAIIRATELETGVKIKPPDLRDYEIELLSNQLFEVQEELERIKGRAAVEAQLVEDQRLPRAILFKTEEPRTFAEYLGQPQIVKPLEYAVRALSGSKRVIDHKLFTGLPGLGKTLIAKVLVNELNARCEREGLRPLPFFWTFAANLDTVVQYDTVARGLLDAEGGVWFIDEIHVLDKEQATKLYALMEDGAYPFHGDRDPTPIPEVLILGATTDYSMLHDALRRRFGEPMMLRPMEASELLRIVTARSFPIQDGAAELLVDRTKWSGAPWESLVLRREAEIVARAHNREFILEPDVQAVFEMYDIDEWGLRWQDREVLRALFRCPRVRRVKGVEEFVAYAARESDVCAMAGLDPGEYRETIKPRLLSRGLIEVRPGYGQAMTPVATARYDALKAS